MDTYCQALKRLLVKDGQATPRTLARIMENLPYSRFTILKHLKEMELDGLVSKSIIAKTTKGRPRVLYSPTSLLLKGEDVISTLRHVQ
jgi:predicted ArsR family transcriptional regulator